MLTLERIRRELGAFPALVRIGLVVMAFAGLADVVAHLEGTGHAGHLHTHAASELSAHAAGFVSMVLILLGVVRDGVRRSRPGRPARRTSTGVT